MRSRDVRPFTVEFKTKRRPSANPASSLWGDTATLFKSASVQDEPPPFKSEPSVPSAAPTITTEEPAQGRRILPDLRPVEAATVETAAPIRVPRAPRRKSLDGTLHNPEEHMTRQAKPTLSLETFDEVPAVHIETAVLEISAERGDDLPVQKITGQAEATEQSLFAPEGSPIIAPPSMLQPRRKWLKRAAELPRGERWKRRLPEVCR